MEDLLTVEEARQWLGLYDNGEAEDQKENTQLTMLIKTAESYVKKATGAWYRDNEDLSNASKLIMLTLVTDWYEHRGHTRETTKTTEVNEKLRHSIQGLILQIQLGEPEVIV